MDRRSVIKHAGLTGILAAAAAPGRPAWFTSARESCPSLFVSDWMNRSRSVSMVAQEASSAAASEAAGLTGSPGCGSAAALLAALDRYPFGCSEQIASRATAMLYVNELAAQAKLAPDGEIEQRDKTLCSFK